MGSVDVESIFSGSVDIGSGSIVLDVNPCLLDSVSLDLNPLLLDLW